MSFLSAIYTIAITPIELLLEVIFTLANKVIGNTGLSIIFLSLAVNFLVLPLYIRADELQNEEREIQKKMAFHIKNIKKTFKGNEQFLKNPAARQPYIQQIISKMGGKPFVWIGIPSWRGDTGFNNLVQQCVGPDRYFDSRHLTLKRCSDRAHPTFEAAGIWMDSIAVWMKDRYPIRMQKPRKKATHKYPLHLLQPES